MHCLAYLSHTRQPLSASALLALLMQARVKNEQRNVTGALVYNGHHFVQVLEGEQPILAQLYARIVQDARHHCVRTLVDAPLAERRFPAWAMAFDEVAADQVGELLGKWLPSCPACQVLEGQWLAEKLQEIVCLRRT